jgi:hypothetical protein
VDAAEDEDEEEEKEAGEAAEEAEVAEEDEAERRGGDGVGAAVEEGGDVRDVRCRFPPPPAFVPAESAAASSELREAGRERDERDEVRRIVSVRRECRGAGQVFSTRVGV